MTSPHTHPPFVPGDRVIWKGQGLGTIERVQVDDGVERFHVKIRHSGMLVAVPTANAAAALRRPLAREAAAALWKDLQTVHEADARTWSERYFDYMRTLAKGTIEDQVERLRRMYSSPFKPSMGELRLIMAYQDAILSELAFVLGTHDGTMDTELKRIHPAFAASAKPRPPEARPPRPAPDGPVVTGFELLGSFEVTGGGLVIAAPGHHAASHDERAGANARVGARSGRWYGYTIEDEDGDAITKLLAVHSSAHAPLDELAQRAVTSARVHTGATSLAILDRAIRDEERFEDELLFGTRVGIILGRGCASPSARGDHAVATVVEDGEAVYVQVDLQ